MYWELNGAGGCSDAPCGLSIEYTSLFLSVTVQVFERGRVISGKEREREEGREGERERGGGGGS